MPKRKHNHKSRHGRHQKGDGTTTTHQRHRTPTLVHWFRKGLRLHDNPSLLDGLKGVKSFRCIYILDPWFAGSSDKGVNRWRFLLQCLEDLDSSLRKLNSRLFLIRGQPADVFPRLFKEWGVTKLSFDEDSEPFGRERDQAIQLLAKDAGVEVVSRLSHTLYDPLEIQDRNNNKPPLTYKRFQSIVSTMGPPPHPVDSITASDIEGMDTAILPDHSDKYGIPTLEELGFDLDNIPAAVWIGGETEANQRLHRHLERKAWVANFERPRMSPTSLMASPTGLGPYLRFGCLSPRLFYWRLAELYQKVKKSTHIPLSLHGHLLWREFFFAVACNNPNFDQMIGNPICVQIPWSRNQEALDRWTEGKTGFPWIDAIMTQLRLEGWIHPLARHAVACFLTRGDLWISWEEGMKVFDEFLLEADWSVNAGNWIWLSCSSFYQHFFHCYCPIKFGRRTDPSGDYVRKYLPILKDYPKEYIFEPWTAPASIQEQAKCVIGTDYPYPMVNHAEASHVNLEKMKKVYQEISQYIGPGLLAAVPSSNNDSGPVPTDKGHTSISTISSIGVRNNTATVSAMDYSGASSADLSHKMLMPQSSHHAMYSSGSVQMTASPVMSASPMMSTASYSTANSSALRYASSSVAADTNYSPNFQMASTSALPITSTPSNYMVTATGDMVIPSHYALATELPPPPPTTYTDTVLASNLDTINYTPLRLESGNPMLGITSGISNQQKNQYQYH